MKTTPILFSAPMILALLAGRKVMTRRLVKWPKTPDWHDWDYEPNSLSGKDESSLWPRYVWNDGAGRTEECALTCPYGGPGDRLWVKETWAVRHEYDAWPPRDIPPDAKVNYMATWEGPCGLRKRPSIFMPRWASRLTLEITGVRVERLQEITEADAIAEGCVTGVWNGDLDFPTYDHREEFRRLWNSLHGPAAWAENPYLWVISFKKL